MLSADDGGWSTTKRRATPALTRVARVFPSCRETSPRLASVAERAVIATARSR
jgi:hypothetical protein